MMSDAKCTVTRERVWPSEPKIATSRDNLWRVSIEENGKGTGKFYDLVKFVGPGGDHRTSWGILMDHEGRLHERPISKIRVMYVKKN
jgi:hypothetical protein